MTTTLHRDYADRLMAAFGTWREGPPAGEPAWARKLRDDAMEQFAAVGLPTVSSEDWRYTSIAGLAREGFLPAASPGNGWSEDGVRRASLGLDGAARLVFVDGRIAPGLCRLGDLPPGARAGSLARMLREDPSRVEPLLGRIASAEAPFVALNTAFFADGAAVIVPPGTVLEAPIHLVYLASAGEGRPSYHPRTVIALGAGAQATVVESYVGPADMPYWCNPVTEAVVEAEAHLRHVKVQREGIAAFHVGALQARVARGGSLHSASLSLGAALARHDLGMILDGEGAEGSLDGLYVVAGSQHVDHHTSVDHARPHCTSRELYKGILDGAARGVFVGRVRVRQDAQGTDARQTNRNLLLSDDAQVDTTPQLEILADDVKCSHGATVGRLDEGALFYLRSRGLGHDEARDLLLHAFAGEILRRIPVPDLRAALAGSLPGALATVAGRP